MPRPYSHFICNSRSTMRERLVTEAVRLRSRIWSFFLLFCRGLHAATLMFTTSVLMPNNSINTQIYQNFNCVVYVRKCRRFNHSVLGLAILFWNQRTVAVLPFHLQFLQVHFKRRDRHRSRCPDDIAFHQPYSGHRRSFPLILSRTTVFAVKSCHPKTVHPSVLMRIIQ